MTTVAADTPFVSVVTPFHNTQEYLEECIRSVLAQTHPNFEYILLDNCSTDASTEIARRYAGQDSRIKLILASELLDQIPNYNRALQQISPHSRFTKIVQADDWIFPNCLKEMTEIAVAYPGVGVIGSYSMYEDSGGQVGHVGLPFSRAPVFSGLEASRRVLLANDGFIGSPTCVMFRSDLVRARRPFFEEAYDSYEDLDACLQLFGYSDFAFVFQILTFNRRSNSGFWSRIGGFAPVLLHLYLLVHRYGPVVLEESERRARFGVLQNRYYSMLASALLSRRSSIFWEFHRKRLASEGLEIDRLRLGWAVFSVMLNALLSPRRCYRKLRRRSSA